MVLIPFLLSVVSLGYLAWLLPQDIRSHERPVPAPFLDDVQVPDATLDWIGLV